MMEDLKVKYLGKCLKVNDVYLETIYIIVERIYFHSENIALEGKGYYYNEKKGLVVKEFEKRNSQLPPPEVGGLHPNKTQRGQVPILVR